MSIIVIQLFLLLLMPESHWTHRIQLSSEFKFPFSRILASQPGRNRVYCWRPWLLNPSDCSFMPMTFVKSASLRFQEVCIWENVHYKSNLIYGTKEEGLLADMKAWEKGANQKTVRPLSQWCTITVFNDRNSRGYTLANKCNLMLTHLFSWQSTAER